MTCYTWHVTCDMWHITCDMWHVTHDMWHVEGVNILSKFQLPSSYGLWFMTSWRSRGKGWPTEWINDGGDCRTAPATPGLLKTLHYFCLWHTKGKVFLLLEGLESSFWGQLGVEFNFQYAGAHYIWVKMPRKNNGLFDVLFSQSLWLKCALLCLPGSLELDCSWEASQCESPQVISLAKSKYLQIFGIFFDKL